MRSALNPESGTVSYTYDDNGNLVTKTDARSIVSTYVYDALNRMTTILYRVNGQPDPNTGDVEYLYDNATNGKGRLWLTFKWGAKPFQTAVGGYDALGRVTQLYDLFGNGQGGWYPAYSINQTYDLAGHVTSITYPSQHTANYNYDGAGRLADKDAQNLAFTGTLSGTPRNYATGIIYDAASRMTEEQFGTTTPIFNKLFYNSRGQLAEIRESTSYTGATDTTWNRGAIINDYSDTCSGVCSGQSMTDNNGNVKKQQHWIPDGNGNLIANFVQQYDYDSLNRLWRVADNLTTPTWRQQYTYDRYGNRTINQGNTFNVGIPTLNFGVDPTTNRLSAPAGYTMSYDPAGNLTTDTYGAAAVTRVYDGENRMTSETTYNSVVSGSYSYDGDGRRVRRIVTVSGQQVETWQVYGIGGELLAEYAANASPTTPQKEYGYRNGQLLITATVTSGGWGALPVFDDNPLNPHYSGETTVRATHITQLRDAINALRSHLGYAPYAWQYSATTNDLISANPIIEMRTALDQALGAPSRGYAPGLAQYQPVMAIHIQELRNRVLSAWNTGTGGVDIRWLVSDQLGTPRMIFDQSGSLTVLDQNGNYASGMTRHDYLPFAEDLVGIGGRTTAMGYTNSDSTRQKFTSYEHDSESGLDFAQARYYSNLLGRFTTVDPLSGNKADQPQSWNRYSYCINNPLVYTDPSGLIWGQRYSKEDNTLYISWYDSRDDMEKAGASAVTDFLVRDTQKGWLVLNAFAKIAEPISDAEYLEGMVNGTNFLRSAGVPIVDMAKHKLLNDVDPIGLAFVTGGMAAPEEAEAGIMTRGVAISERGLQIVEEHLIKLEGTLSMENALMLARLRSALWSGDRLTGADASFYMHETSEATMTNRIMAEKGLSYQEAADSAHALTLERYERFGMAQITNYHPDVIRSTLRINGALNWSDAYLNRWNIKK